MREIFNIFAENWPDFQRMFHRRLESTIYPLLMVVLLLLAGCGDGGSVDAAMMMMAMVILLLYYAFRHSVLRLNVRTSSHCPLDANAS